LQVGAGQGQAGARVEEVVGREAGGAEVRGQAGLAGLRAGLAGQRGGLLVEPRGAVAQALPPVQERPVALQAGRPIQTLGAGLRTPLAHLPAPPIPLGTLADTVPGLLQEPPPAADTSQPVLTSQAGCEAGPADSFEEGVEGGVGARLAGGQAAGQVQEARLAGGAGGGGLAGVARRGAGLAGASRVVVEGRRALRHAAALVPKEPSHTAPTRSQASTLQTRPGTPLTSLPILIVPRHAPIDTGPGHHQLGIRTLGAIGGREGAGQAGGGAGLAGAGLLVG
jgi:hypothetical protein